MLSIGTENGVPVLKVVSSPDTGPATLFLFCSSIILNERSVHVYELCEKCFVPRHFG